MIPVLARLADIWIGRNARSDPSAVAAVAGLRPAVVITGGSAGIGLAIAHRFAAAGRDIVLVARMASDLEKAAADLHRDTKAVVDTIPLDLAATGAAAELVAALRRAGCYGDVLVNNAGIGMAGAFIDGDPARLDDMLALNVCAATRLIRLMLPDMIARGRGGILTVASLGAYTPGPYQAAYYATKAYVLSLSEAVGHEVAGRGVRCSAVVPGPVATLFHARMGAERSPYRLAMPSSSAQSVARSAYRGYMLGRSVIIPGVVSMLMMPATRILPHPVLLPIIGTLLKPWRRSRRD